MGEKETETTAERSAYPRTEVAKREADPGAGAPAPLEATTVKGSKSNSDN